MAAKQSQQINNEFLSVAAFFFILCMAVKGSWSDQVLVQSQVELVYNPLMGALNDNLILPNTDSPIQKIELLEIRLDSPVPVGILNIGFKNKNIPIKDGQYSSRTHIRDRKSTRLNSSHRL